MATLALDPAYRRVEVYEFMQMDFGGAKAELDDGIIFIVAGGTPQHALVASRLIRALGNQLSGTGCEPVGSDMGVRTRERSVRFPDVGVYRGPILPTDDPDQVAPRVIVEVLSPSTVKHDQSEKLIEYQALAAVQEIWFIDPDTGAARVVRRTEDNGWSDRWLGGDEAFDFPSIGARIERAGIGLPSSGERP